MCEKLIFKVPYACGVLIFLANIFLPGSGTMASGCCNGTKFSVLAILLGIGQFLTAVFIVGWIWSIYHGYQIYAVSHPEY